MDYTIEKKVIHHEWDELIIQAEDVLINPEIFSHDPEDYEEGDTLEGYPTLVFEKGRVDIDEMWGVKDGNVWFSSYAGGVSTVREGEIIHCFHMSERPLGKFLTLEIRATDDLLARIENLKNGEAP